MLTIKWSERHESDVSRHSLEEKDREIDGAMPDISEKSYCRLGCWSSEALSTAHGVNLITLHALTLNVKINCGSSRVPAKRPSLPAPILPLFPPSAPAEKTNHISTSPHNIYPPNISLCTNTLVPHSTVLPLSARAFQNTIVRPCSTLVDPSRNSPSSHNCLDTTGIFEGSSLLSLSPSRQIHVLSI